MSVINKMLRDLDKRQGRSGVPGLVEPVLRNGTVSVSVADARARRRRAILGVLLLGALAVVLVGFWPAQSPLSQRPQAVAAVAVPPSLVPASAAPVLSPASAPAVLAAASSAQPLIPLASSAASAPLAASVSVASAPRVAAAASGALPPVALLPAVGAASAAVVARAAASAATAVPAKPASAATVVNAAQGQTPGASAVVPVPAKSLPAAVSASAVLPVRAASAPVAVLPARAPSAAVPAGVGVSPAKPVASAPGTPASAGAAAVVAPSGAAASAPVAASGAEMAQLAQRQQLAVADTLAQAQGLWNSGARDAGIEMLLQAVASLERSAANNPAAVTSLATLVRELARMQLAQARPGAVWELLSRLEPYLRTDADLWAVRANAAQRLGRHQESVHAYMMALQIRPAEPRWLLGAAVSLAAMGQIASASDMAQKARAAGPISADVLAYLRQMGVQVKEP